MHQLAHPDGELATARAAGSAGVMFCAATFSTYSMEDIAQAAAGPRWFQLYCYQDRGLTEGLVDRAVASGYQAIVLTADAPVLSVRRRDVYNRFVPPQGVSLKNFEAATDHTMERAPGSSLGAYVSAKAEDNLTWHDVDWLAARSKLSVLVKGVLTGEDARLAADHGAAGVIVSNHGGRQLDGAITAVDALPEVAAALEDDSVVVLADGGVRRGTDVIKLLALGANATLIGRPVQWGLAVDGEAGARAVLDLLRREFDIALALSGCKSAADVSRDLVVRL
jgi:isopentenyl diphosphate isomerase/L-lactate dehydrogenase-like FMN-dependent dehydrogenase